MSPCSEDSDQSFVPGMSEQIWPSPAVCNHPPVTIRKDTFPPGGLQTRNISVSGVTDVWDLVRPVIDRKCKDSVSIVRVTTFY